MTAAEPFWQCAWVLANKYAGVVERETASTKGNEHCTSVYLIQKIPLITAPLLVIYQHHLYRHPYYLGASTEMDCQASSPNLFVEGLSDPHPMIRTLPFWA